VSAREHPSERCVIVVDQTLAPGLAANAAALLALTLGAISPRLVGAELEARANRGAQPATRMSSASVIR